MKILIGAFITVLTIHSALVSAADWTYSTETDDFLDTTQHTARVTAEEGGGYAVARCDENSDFDMYFSVDEFIGSQDRYPVRFRIDKQSPGSSEWGVSTEGTAVFVSNSDKVMLARQMLEGSKLFWARGRNAKSGAHRAPTAR